jgi:transcription elongation factor GreA
VLDPGAGDHLGADEAGPVAPALAPERLDADARHRREDDPGRHLDLADPPGFPEIHAHNAENGTRVLLTAPGAGGTILPRRTAVSSRRPFSCKGARVKEVILTPEGFEKLKVEIQYLSNDRRREVAERIRVAREFGDIAENAEYDTAKTEQGHLEARIALLEERLAHARVVTKKEIKSGEVSIGTKVRLRDVGANKTVEYHIVGSAEADPAVNKLSNESPVGKAIMGRKKGDTVEVAAPRGKLKFKIMDIKAA